MRGRIPKEPTQDTYITGDNLSAIKARLLLILAIRTLGRLTAFADAESPTPQERSGWWPRLGDTRRYLTRISGNRENNTQSADWAA